jgi:hypothetical protein
MLKTHSKFAHVALALSLMLSLAAAPADARPTSSSSSFKSGFSSQRSSSASSSSSSSSSSKSSKGGFGSFSRRPDTKAPAADAHKSDSALSRKLDKESSEANALRTLDERRAAQVQAQAARNAQAAPGYGQPAGGYQDNARTPPPQGYGYGPAPAQVPAPAPIIVNQNSGGGLGHVVAGAILARSAANAHANGNNNNNGGYYPAPGGAAGELADKAGAGSVGASAGAASAPAASAPAAPAPASASVLGSIARSFLWLCVLSLIGWGIYVAWKRVKARREANKPNYSFERN